MSNLEDEPEIMLEVCVDSVESAKAYVAISCFMVPCKCQGIPRLMLSLVLSMEVPNVWNFAGR